MPSCSTKHRLTLSALAYYENNLHPDEGRRDEIAAHVRTTWTPRRCSAWSTVGTFIGRHPGL